MTLQKTPAREQEPNIRNKNFKEVSQGYDEELALNEASRCLNCKNMPCVSGCPVNVRIPEFIAKIAAHDYEGAYAIIKTTNSLPARSAAAYAPRKTSVRASASAVLRANL